MFKIHIVNWSNRKAYEEPLERHFRLRHQIYVGERNWRQVERPIPLEIDAFDNADAIYLLGIDDNGNLCGGSRFVPTLKPHLLSDVFPMLADGDVPRGHDIYEWTRIFVAPLLRKPGEPSLAAGIVLCGLLEAAFVLGIQQISVVCETFWLDRLERLGWPIKRLGPTIDHPDGAIIALLIQVTEAALASSRAAYGLDDVSVLAACQLKNSQKPEPPAIVIQA
ncbi:acyl-homoserine-lactone synthase [Aquamicrobium defluvii]|nr:acyl-homoserine-lactone synthase [Aquamicrobium defluvii]